MTELERILVKVASEMIQGVELIDLLLGSGKCQCRGGDWQEDGRSEYSAMTGFKTSTNHII